MLGYLGRRGGVILSFSQSELPTWQTASDLPMTFTSTCHHNISISPASQLKLVICFIHAVTMQITAHSFHLIVLNWLTAQKEH